MFLVIAFAVVLVVAATVVAGNRSRQTRPAVPGGNRRDHFGDALVVNGTAAQYVVNG